MENELVKVHIWELPEKIDNIDKTNDFTLIHDGVELKKVSFEKLYEYFNQDYKIENTVLFFETLISNEDKRYEESYDKLELSIEKYKEIILKLIEKFLSVRGKIRDLETDTNKMDFEIEDITESFKIIEAKHNSLADHFQSFNDKISFIDLNVENHETNISKLNTSIITMNYYKSVLNSDYSYISDFVPTATESIEVQVNNNGEMLSKSINEYYDRIISIIDHYHHHI